MPLTMAGVGREQVVREIHGKDEVRTFLEKLGFVKGAEIEVVSFLNGNMIVSVKGTRVALDRAMAQRIMVM